MLAAFLDVEGTFENTAFESLIRVVKNRGVETYTREWTMLHGKQVEVEFTDYRENQLVMHYYYT